MPAASGRVNVGDGRELTLLGRCRRVELKEQGRSRPRIAPLQFE